MSRASIVAVAAIALSSCPGAAIAEAPDFNPIGKQETLVIPVRVPVPKDWDGKECANAKDPNDVAKWKVAATRYGASPRFTADQVVERLQISTGVNSFFRQSSYGATSFDFVPLADPETADGWWTAPQTQPQYCKSGIVGFGSPGSLMSDVMTKIYQRAINSGQVTRAESDRYHRVLVILNVAGRGGQTSPRVYYPIAPAGAAAPAANREFSAAFVNQDVNDESFFAVTRHELGHTLRLSAHYFAGCNQFKPSDPECLGPWDPMGWDWVGTEFAGFSRVEAGWIPDTPDRVVNMPQLVTTGDKPDFTLTVPLAPIEAAFGSPGFSTGKPLVARLPIGSTVPFKGLYLECREQIGFDTQRPGVADPKAIRGIPSATGGILISYVDMTRDNPRIYVERPNEERSLSAATLGPGETFVLDAYARHLEIANTGGPGRCTASVKGSYTGKYTGYEVGFRPAEAGSAGFTLPTGASSGDVWVDSAANGIGRYDLGQDVTQVAGVKVPAAGGDAPVAGTKSRIWFRLHNFGDRRASNVKVKVMASRSPLDEQCSRARRAVGTVTIRSLGAGDDALRSVRWTPRGVEALGQVVVQAGGGRGELDRSNNTARRTFDPLGGRSAARGRILLPAAFGCRNPSGLEILPDAAPGWRIELRPRIRARTRFVDLQVARPRGAEGRPQGLTFVKERVDADDYPAPEGTPSIPFHDVHQEAIASVTLLRRYLDPARLDLRCGQGVGLGDPVDVAGKAREGGAAAVIELDYTAPDGRPSIQRRTADGQGRFADAFVPDRAGSWRVQARWSGDVGHLGAVSRSCAFTVGQGIKREPPS